MRKWLVGLLALACIGATSWAETATYTVASKTEVTLSGTAPDGATAVYEQTANNMGQATANNTLKLTLKGYEGTTITGLKLSMKSNASKGAGSLSVTCGDAIIAGIENSKFNSENWNGAWSTEYVDIVPAVTATSVDGDVVILISATENSLYCQSYTVEYTAGDPVFSVKFDKENWFKVAQGQASSVTAIPQYGIEPYTFAWESDTPELNGGTTDTLEIPATLAEGDYTVLCQVTDDNGEGDVINALIGFTVEAIPVITGGSATYTVTGKSKVEASGDVPPESTAEYSQTYGTAGQATKDNSMTLTLKGYEGMTITGLTLSMKSNKSAGAGSLSVTCQDAVIASIEDSAFNVGWSDAYTQEYVDVTPEVTPTAVTGDVTITIAASVNSLYCQSYTVQFEAGEPGLGVTLDKANGFTVDLGTPDSITATAKNGVEPYTYAWTSDTPDLNGTGATLAIPATLAEGDYTVQVEVTDAESNKANKQIYFSVVAPAVLYPVTIAAGIENGEITVDKTEAAEGETVTVTATPAEGFALEAITVNGIAITATTFPMPAEAVEVGATFAEVKDYAELPFVAEDTPCSGPWQKPKANGLSHKGLGTDYADGSAKFDTTGDWMQVKFTGTPGTLSFGIKGNSLSSEKPSTFLVQESATGEEDAWTTIGTYVTDEGLTGTKTDVSLELSATSQFVRFFYETKGAGNVGIYDVYITSGGPAVFSVTLDPAKDFEVEQNAEAFVTAIPKHAAEGVVGYAWWIDGTPVDTAGEVLALATAELGPHKVICEATDAAGAKADAHVIYTVVAPAVKYAVNVAIGILNGGVTADKEQAEEGELVTLTSSPDAGYKLGTFLVDGEAIEGNSFNMPAHDVLVSAEFIVKPVVAGFTKITSLDELTEGEYVITGAKAGESEYAMLAEIAGTSTKYIPRRDTAVEIEDDVVTDAEDSIIWTLAQGDNGWTIYNAAETAGYVGYVASGKNSAGYEAEPSEKSSWTISVAEGGLFAIVNVADSTRNLRYNTSSGQERFACYAPNTSGSLTGVALALYKGSSGPAVPSVSLSASATEVEVNEPVTITATAKNFSADVEWAWEGNDGGSADGAVYTVKTAVAGEFTIKATATAGDEIAEKSVTITVSEPAQKYAVTVEQAAGGTIAVDKPEAEAGETVTVTATADDGMRLVAITVNGSPIEGTSFEMPAEPVTVSATFEEFEVPPYYFQFESNDLPTGYSATAADVANTGSTAAEVATVPFTLQRVARGNADGDKKVGAAAMRLAPIGETNAFAYNSAAFSEAITAISFQYGIYGTSDKCDSFTVSTSEDGEEWTLLADLTATATSGLQTFESSDLPDNTLFIRFDAANTVAGNTRRMDIDEIQLWTGAPSPKIVYSGETTIALGGTFEIIFGLLNYDGDFQWEVASREGGTIVPEGRDGLYTWTPTEATDGVTIKVVARSGELDIATKEVVLTVTEPGPQPGEPAIVFGGDDSGVVGQPVNFTVTAVNLRDNTVYGNGFTGAEGSSLSDNDITYDFPDVSFVPDVAGVYKFDFVAGEQDEEISDSIEITVTAGPGPQPGGFQITGLAKTGDNLVLTFAGEGTPAVLGTASLASPQEWTPVEGATVSGTTATVPMGAQNYIRLQ